MSKGWTPERRAAQAERIRALKPWTKSTGPKTKAGKSRASLNAIKHGERSASMRNAAKMLRLSREFRLMALATLIDMKFEEAFRTVQTDYINKHVKTKD